MYQDAMELELEDEYEDELEDELEGEYEADDSEGPFSEAEEMELASELLSLSDEAELEMFLGKLIKRAGRAVGKFAKSSTGRALGGILKKAAKTALPVLGRAAGGFIGGPAGAALGGKLASAAGRAFGLELEGMSPEDQEFEAARRFVRFAGTAAQKAAQAPRSAPAGKVATVAAKSAARTYAPGLLRTPGVLTPGRAATSRGHTGRWIRRGRNIILLGA